MFQSLKYFVGQTVGFETLKKDVALFGYERTQSAYEEGQYAVRGSILDVFPVNFDSPVRIDREEHLGPPRGHHPAGQR
jgi:transcription-repair coupling factor (superfamily II helicase)